jgi:NADH-quinone oxidoreductase subunit G
VLNARIRKRWLKGGCRSAVVGEKADLTYRYEHYLGAGPDSLAQLAEHSRAGPQRQKPMVIVGQGALARADGRPCWPLPPVSRGTSSRRLERLQRAAHRGIPRRRARHLRVPSAGSLSARPTDARGREGWRTRRAVPDRRGRDRHRGSRRRVRRLSSARHGDAGAHRAERDPPGRRLYRKAGDLRQHRGPRADYGKRASFPPGDAREDWAILRALSDVLGRRLPWNNLDELRAAMYKVAPQLMRLDQRDACGHGGTG